MQVQMGALAAIPQLESRTDEQPQERPALRQMMKASLALAERRPDELRDAMEKLGQEAPSGRQMFMLRMMGLLMPPASAGIVARVRGILLIVLIVILLLAIGTGIVQAIGLIFGGIGVGSSIFFGFLLVVVALGILVFVGRRRQARAQATRAAQLQR